MLQRSRRDNARITRRAVIAGGALAGLGLIGRRRSVTAHSGDGWIEGVPIPRARSELAAAVIDDVIYVAGGFGGGARVDRFDTVTNAWTRIADLPVAVHHPGVAALDGRLVVAGGYTEDRHEAIADVWAYDPDRNVWDALAPLPAPKGAFGLVALEGALYAAGGAFERLGGPVSGDLLRYDPARDRWEPLPPLPTPREHLAVVAAGGRIYAVGGRANGDESDRFAAANEVYDPDAAAWSALPALPVPRGGLSGVAIDGGFVVLGGERGQTAFADANRYDPAANQWTALPPMPTARHGLASAYVRGTLYAMTGSVKAGGVENTPVVEILSLAPEATPTP